MSTKGFEKRTCKRFVIPWTEVYLKKKKRFFNKEIEEGPFPLVNISRGGLRFFSDISLKINSEISVKIHIPEEETPLFLKGKVQWLSIAPGKSFEFSIGVSFFPYGKKSKENDLNCLKRIKIWEAKYSKKAEEDYGLPVM